MNLIINRNEWFSTFNGKIVTTEEALRIANKALKEGRAKLKIDTNDTLAYQID